jgi:predicted nucleic acid-binding protein
LLALSLRYDLSSHDAAYLDLALRRQWPIATQDDALAQAARLAGVGVVDA